MRHSRVYNTPSAEQQKMLAPWPSANLLKSNLYVIIRIIIVKYRLNYVLLLKNWIALT
jgi:hypothetical protein